MLLNQPGSHMTQVETAAVPTPNYDDDIVRKFFGATVLWGAVGLSLGAAQKRLARRSQETTP